MVRCKAIGFAPIAQEKSKEWMMLQLVLVFAAGVVVGVVMGVFLMSLMCASGRASDAEEHQSHDEHEY